MHASVYGVLDHVLVNLDAGPLDGSHGSAWDTLPPLQRWWYAVTKTVGPAPTLTPGVLGQSALLLLLAATAILRSSAPAGPAGTRPAP